MTQPLPAPQTMAGFLLATADQVDASAANAPRLVPRTVTFVRATTALWRSVADEMNREPWREDSPVWAAAVAAAAAWSP